MRRPGTSVTGLRLHLIFRRISWRQFSQMKEDELPAGSRPRRRPCLMPRPWSLSICHPPVVVVEPPQELSWRPYLIALLLILLGIIPVGYEYFAYKGVTRLDWDTQVDRDRVIVMEWRTWNAVEGQYETSIEIDLSDPAWPVSNPTCVWQEGTNVVGPWTEPEWRLLCALYEYSPAPDYPVGAITSRHPYDFDNGVIFWRSSYDSYQVGWMRPIFGP